MPPEQEVISTLVGHEVSCTNGRSLIDVVATLRGVGPGVMWLSFGNNPPVGIPFLDGERIHHHAQCRTCVEKLQPTRDIQCPGHWHYSDHCLDHSSGRHRYVEGRPDEWQHNADCSLCHGFGRITLDRLLEVYPWLD